MYIQYRNLRDQTDILCLGALKYTDMFGTPCNTKVCLQLAFLWNAVAKKIS